MAILNVCWLAAAIMVQILACVPVRSIWNALIPRHCVDYGPYVVAVLSVELAFDLILFIIPILEIGKLQLNSTKRWLLVLVFALGGL